MRAPHKFDALAAVVILLRAVEDPRERVAAILAVRAEMTRVDHRLRDLLGATMLELRAATPPATWADIGELLHVTPQAAQQLAAKIHHQHTPEGTPVTP